MTFVLACVDLGLIDFPKDAMAEIKVKIGKLSAHLHEMSKNDPELPKHLCSPALGKPELDVAYAVACKPFVGN